MGKNKLKTFNDLTGFISVNKGEPFIMCNGFLLKQEAIKHIKHHETLVHGVGYVDYQYVFINNWIKDFFNITEVDLKWQKEN